MAAASTTRTIEPPDSVALYINVPETKSFQVLFFARCLEPDPKHFQQEKSQGNLSKKSSQGISRPGIQPGQRPIGRGSLPRGTTMSATRMVGWIYWSKAGLTNLLYCLMTPSISRPRSLMSLRKRRTRRMSESVSTNIFISRSCRGKKQRESSGIWVLNRSLWSNVFQPWQL